MEQKNNTEENSASLSKSERGLIALILSSIVILLLTDILTDSREGANWPHLLIEIGIVLISAFGFVVLIRDFFHKGHEIIHHHAEIEKLQQEALRWKEESKKHIEGLSQAIDSQMARWKLSQAEKEVALLLLKGLSLKEIANIRETSEKTARAHSVAVYEKSGLSGRSELAAFFLEDLLLPKDKI